jgi:hypothetical protein
MGKKERVRTEEIEEREIVCINMCVWGCRREREGNFCLQFHLRIDCEQHPLDEERECFDREY